MITKRIDSEIFKSQESYKTVLTGICSDFNQEIESLKDAINLKEQGIQALRNDNFQLRNILVNLRNEFNQFKTERKQENSLNKGTLDQMKKSILEMNHQRTHTNMIPPNYNNQNQIPFNNNCQPGDKRCHNDEQLKQLINKMKKMNKYLNNVKIKFILKNEVEDQNNHLTRRFKILEESFKNLEGLVNFKFTDHSSLFNEFNMKLVTLSKNFIISKNEMQEHMENMRRVLRIEYEDSQTSDLTMFYSKDSENVSCFLDDSKNRGSSKLEKKVRITVNFEQVTFDSQVLQKNISDFDNMKRGGRSRNDERKNGSLKDKFY